MTTIDTSWLYAFIDELDVHHDEAIQQAKASSLLRMPQLVLAELLQLVQFRVRKQKGDAAARAIARQILHDLETAPTFLVTQTDAPSTSALFRRHARLSYVDAAAIATAMRNGEDLLSFDEVQLAAWAKERRT